LQPTFDESASEILDVVPIIMREIRSEMRSRRSPDLTIPQFRTLLFVNRNRGSSLLEVATFMGLTPASTSRLVDVLISRSLMTRQEHPQDRRRIKLALTSQGTAVLQTCKKGTLSHLSGKLSGLSAEDMKIITKAMQTLRQVFAVSVRMEDR